MFQFEFCSPLFTEAKAVYISQKKTFYFELLRGKFWESRQREIENKNENVR